jgi:type II restriction/modification system DNA methylase subunit YeeA
MSTPVFDSDDFPKLIYRQTFEAIYEYLEERLRTDPTFTPEDIRQFLKDAYVRQGDDWIGRGVLETKKLDAVIAAHECFLAEWEAESGTDA